MPLVFLLYALFASVMITAKWGLGFAEPLFFVGSRMVLAGFLLLFYTAIVKKETIFFKRKVFLRLLGLATFNVYLTNALEFWGLQYLTSFKTCFLYSLSPFFAALFSYFVFSEKMTVMKWIGLTIGFIGFYPMIMHQSTQEAQIGTLLFFSWAEIAVMLAAMCTVYGWVLLRQVIQQDGMSPVLANGWSMVAGGAMAFINSLVIEDWNPVPVTEWSPFLTSFAYLLIVSNLICYNLYGVLLKRYTATFMSMAGFSTPIFTAIFGVLILGEEISHHFIFSAVIVFIGLYLFNREELKQGYAIS